MQKYPHIVDSNLSFYRCLLWYCSGMCSIPKLSKYVVVPSFTYKEALIDLQLSRFTLLNVDLFLYFYISMLDKR